MCGPKSSPTRADIPQPSSMTCEEELRRPSVNSGFLSGELIHSAKSGVIFQTTAVILV